MYLSSKLKEYYLQAFSEVKNSDNEFWDLDNGIVDYLNSINKNENIQTLYSKYGNHLGGFNPESYLVFAYSKKVELKLFREIIPNLIFNYNTRHESICRYSFNEPRMREDKNDKGGILKLKCVNDPQYFNINNIRITLEDGNNKIHDRFWQDLNDALSKIT